MTKDLDEGIDAAVLLRTKIRNTLYNNEIGFSMRNAGNRTAEQMAEDLVEQLATVAESMTNQYVTKKQIEELKQVFQQPAYNAKGKHSTVLFYRSEYFEDRIAELEKQLEEWKQ